MERSSGTGFVLQCKCQARLQMAPVIPHRRACFTLCFRVYSCLLSRAAVQGQGTEEGEAQSSTRRLLCAGIAVPAALGAAPLDFCAIALSSPTLSVPPGLSPWLLTGKAVLHWSDASSCLDAAPAAQQPCPNGAKTCMAVRGAQHSTRLSAASLIGSALALGSLNAMCILEGHECN